LKGNRRLLLILLVAAVALAVVFSATHITDIGRNGTSLPAGCVAPPNGFLIVANNLGYNDSISHGAPTKPYPVITAHKGETVNITVCNTDRQTHGFQIEHYLDSSIESAAPGQVLKVSFVAERTGTFKIYCPILCTIHIYMQGGQLIVT
jgi:hypothetical protein